MSLGLIAFIVLAVTTFFSNGVQAYIHYEAYPLFASVGKAEFAAYIKEYEARTSNEALFVYALDKFINGLIRITDGGKYFRINKIDFARFQEGMVDHRRKAHSHPAVAKYYDKLLQVFLSHPEQFYQAGRDD